MRSINIEKNIEYLDLYLADFKKKIQQIFDTQIFIT